MNPQAADARTLVLKIILPQPMPEKSYMLKGRYNTVPSQSQTPLTRTYEIVTSSEGVDVYLLLKNSHYPASQKDIEPCEKELLRLASLPLAFPLQEEKRELLVEYLEGLLDVRESQGTRRADMGLPQIHDLSQLPLS